MLICSVEETDDLVQGGILEDQHMLRHLETERWREFMLRITQTHQSYVEKGKFKELQRL